MLSERLRQPYFIYLLFISTIGAVLAIWGGVQFPGYEQKINFLLLLILVALSQIATTSVTVSEKAGITYSVAPAVSMAAIPFFGPVAAALVEAVSSLTIWLIKPADKTTWKRSWEQLAFNTGMSCIAVLLAGWVFLLTREQLGPRTFFGIIIPWLLAAIVYEQANLWMLITIIRLQHGQDINLLQMWRENSWATSINIVILSVGGGLLAFAVDQFHSGK